MCVHVWKVEWCLWRKEERVHVCVHVHVCTCMCVDVWMGVGPCEERRERKMLYVNEEVMKPQLNMSLDTCALKTSRCCTSSNICFTTPPNDASSLSAG